MLLLRDVHYVRPWGECRPAFVTGDGAEIDTVNLTVERDIWDMLRDGCADASETAPGVQHDADGKPGTWHTVRECPLTRAH